MYMRILDMFRIFSFIISSCSYYRMAAFYFIFHPQSWISEVFVSLTAKTKYRNFETNIPRKGL